MIVFGVFNWSI